MTSSWLYAFELKRNYIGKRWILSQANKTREKNKHLFDQSIKMVTEIQSETRRFLIRKAGKAGFPWQHSDSQFVKNFKQTGLMVKPECPQSNFLQ